MRLYGRAGDWTRRAPACSSRDARSALHGPNFAARADIGAPDSEAFYFQGAAKGWARRQEAPRAQRVCSYPLAWCARMQ